jgi:type IV secretory pathway TrbD component
MSGMLLVRMFRSSSFLASLAFDVIGVGGQFIALTLGAIGIVQPIIALGLIIALLVEHFVTKRRMSLVEFIVSVIATAALAVFVGLRPLHVHDVIHEGWSLIVTMLSLALCGALLVIARWSIRLPSLLISTVAAIALGCAAVLEREVGIQLHHGVLSVLGHWQVWGLLVVAPVTLLLVQSAFQLAEMKTVLPVLTVGEPILAVALGRLMLTEPIFPGSTWYVGLALVVVLVASLLYLARSESRFEDVIARRADGESHP